MTAELWEFPLPHHQALHPDGWQNKRKALLAEYGTFLTLPVPKWPRGSEDSSVCSAVA